MTQVLARSFLEAVARGEATAEMLSTFLANVVDSDLARAALDMLDDKFRWRRAIELAGEIIGRTETNAPKTARS